MRLSALLSLALAFGVAGCGSDAGLAPVAAVGTPDTVRWYAEGRLSPTALTWEPVAGHAAMNLWISRTVYAQCTLPARDVIGRYDVAFRADLPLGWQYGVKIDGDSIAFRPDPVVTCTGGVVEATVDADTMTAKTIVRYTTTCGAAADTTTLRLVRMR